MSKSDYDFIDNFIQRAAPDAGITACASISKGIGDLLLAMTHMPEYDYLGTPEIENGRVIRWAGHRFIEDKSADIEKILRQELAESGKKYASWLEYKRLINSKTSKQAYMAFISQGFQDILAFVCSTSKLSERQQSVLHMRFMEGKTLQEVALLQPRPVTIERIRQIERRAIRRMGQPHVVEKVRNHLKIA